MGCTSPNLVAASGTDNAQAVNARQSRKVHNTGHAPRPELHTRKSVAHAPSQMASRRSIPKAKLPKPVPSPALDGEVVKNSTRVTLANSN